MAKQIQTRTVICITDVETPADKMLPEPLFVVGEKYLLYYVNNKPAFVRSRLWDLEWSIYKDHFDFLKKGGK